MIKQTPTQHCHRVTQLNSQTSPQKDRFRNILVGQVQILQHCMEILLIYYNHITYVAHKRRSKSPSPTAEQHFGISWDWICCSNSLSLLHFLVVPEATLPLFFFFNVDSWNLHLQCCVKVLTHLSFLYILLKWEIGAAIYWNVEMQHKNLENRDLVWPQA